MIGRQLLASTFLACLLLESSTSRAQTSLDWLDALDGNGSAPSASRYAGILLDVDLLPTAPSARAWDERLLRLPSAASAEAYTLGLRGLTNHLHPAPLPGPRRLSWSMATYDVFERNEGKTLGSLLFDLKDVPPAEHQTRWADSIPGGGLMLYFTLHGSNGSD